MPPRPLSPTEPSAAVHPCSILDTNVSKPFQSFISTTRCFRQYLFIERLHACIKSWCMLFDCKLGLSDATSGQCNLRTERLGRDRKTHV